MEEEGEGGLGSEGVRWLDQSSSHSTNATQWDSQWVVVSAPDPNHPSADRFQYVILDAIRAGVGLGLGPRLSGWLLSFRIRLLALLSSAIRNWGRTPRNGTSDLHTCALYVQSQCRGCNLLAHGSSTYLQEYGEPCHL